MPLSPMRSSGLNFTAARSAMIDSQIKPNNVINPSLLTTMQNIAREDFVQAADRELAYAERDAPLGQGRFLLSPMVQARLIEAADLTDRDFALDVGCGSGYSSVIIASMVNGGVALETDAELARQAEQNLHAYGSERFQVVTGDLARGWPRGGPYSAIIVNGMIDDAPQNLLQQLSDKGRLVALQMGADGIGHAVRFTNIKGAITKQVLFDATAPYLEEFMAKPTFQF